MLVVLVSVFVVAATIVDDVGRLQRHCYVLSLLSFLMLHFNDVSDASLVSC